METVDHENIELTQKDALDDPNYPDTERPLAEEDEF